MALGAPQLPGDHDGNVERALTMRLPAQPNFEKRTGSLPQPASVSRTGLCAVSGTTVFPTVTCIVSGATIVNAMLPPKRRAVADRPSQPSP